MRIVGSAARENNGKREKTFFRCVLKVSDQIITGDVPNGSATDGAESIGLDPVFTKGVFEREGEWMIIPDLLQVVSHDASAAG
ncbi:MAG: hypothetical protein D3924_04040 [Candidatus Electrothrix sp. AR4]|nr:hypothetical protein [Candidatus Electrothrix sp. AR4]